MWKKDPLPRLRSWLGANGWWDKDREEALIEDVKRRIDDARVHAAAVPPQKPTDIFDYLYADLPEALSAPLARARTALPTSFATYR